MAATYWTTSKVTLATTIFFAILPLNFIKAGFDVFPMIMNWVGDQALEDKVRQAYSWLGIDAQPGSGSIHIGL